MLVRAAGVATVVQPRAALQGAPDKRRFMRANLEYYKRAEDTVEAFPAALLARRARTRER